MTLPLVFRRRAQADLAAAFNWYEALVRGTAARAWRRVPLRPSDHLQITFSTLGTLGTLGLHPDIFGCVYENVHRAVVTRFPFAVFYIMEAKRVVILRVLHSARDPKLWPPAKRRRG